MREAVKSCGRQVKSVDKMPAWPRCMNAPTPWWIVTRVDLPIGLPLSRSAGFACAPLFCREGEANVKLFLIETGLEFPGVARFSLSGENI